MRIYKERTEWFDVPDDPDGSRLKIKYLNQGQQQELIAKCLKRTIIDEGGEQKTQSVIDDVKLTRESAIERIVDWENIIGKDGKPADCTRLSKIEISKEEEFTDVFKDMIAKLDTMVKSEREQEEKNLLKSQDGSQE